MNKNTTKEATAAERATLDSSAHRRLADAQLLRSLSDRYQLFCARVVRCLPREHATSVAAKLFLRRACLELITAVPTGLRESGMLRFSVRRAAAKRAEFPHIRI